MTHHPAVLVLQLVAVEHVGPGKAVEADEDTDGLLRPDGDGVLPTMLPCRRRRAVAIQHLKEDAMEMERMRVVHAGIGMVWWLPCVGAPLEMRQISVVPCRGVASMR